MKEEESYQKHVPLSLKQHNNKKDLDYKQKFLFV